MYTAFSRRVTYPIRVSAFGGAVIREDAVPYLASERYEDEGSERVAIGSVSVARDAFWRVTLSVPLPREDAAFLRIEREGPLPDGYRGAEENAAFSVPAQELDAVMRALEGVIAQARRDGVIA